ncbi:MAG: putative transporter permease protein [Chloroflexi bacterium]|nr:putative transporter permease protein [Chloroflexota bacterium]
MLNLTILVIVFVLSVAVGSVFIPPLTQLRMLLAQLPGISIVQGWPETFNTIVYDIRLPHAVLILLAGSALACSGAAYQGLFRNPLADPYLIGVASGAGLAAVIAMTVHWPQSALGLYAVPAAAFIGALLTVFIVYALARTGRAAPTPTLILAGVAVSSFATSLTSFLMLRSSSELRRALAYQLGGALLPGWEPVVAMLPYFLIGVTVLVLSGFTLNVLQFGDELNVLQFGDEQAQQLGLEVERRKLIIILAASLTTAAAVAFAGIIGFIGLVVPHVIRIFWGADYRQIMVLSILAGGSVLLATDIVARTVLAPQVLPVGIITALVGAPFFLWVLRRAKSTGNW